MYKSKEILMKELSKTNLTTVIKSTGKCITGKKPHKTSNTEHYGI